jgi:hypothetical protein
MWSIDTIHVWEFGANLEPDVNVNIIPQGHPESTLNRVKDKIERQNSPPDIS